MYADGLTWAHVLKLGFLEIRRHPDIVNRNNGKQALPRLNPLAEFDSLAADDTADWRVDLRVAKIQFRGAYIRLGSLYFADARLRLGLRVRTPLGGRSRLLYLCLPFRDEATRLRDFLLNGCDSSAVGLQRLCGCDRLRLPRVVFGTRDLALFD